MNLKYMKVSLFVNNLQEKMNFFHDILIHWDAYIIYIYYFFNITPILHLSPCPWGTLCTSLQLIEGQVCVFFYFFFIKRQQIDQIEL